MYLIEAQGIPRFRQLLEDMYYSVAPSKFPIHTAHVEVIGFSKIQLEQYGPSS